MGTVVWAAAMMSTMVVTALLPTTDCGRTTVDDGSDCRGSWDCGKARTTNINNDPRGGDCQATGLVNALKCGDGRGVADTRTMTTTMHKQT